MVGLLFGIESIHDGIIDECGAIKIIIPRRIVRYSEKTHTQHDFVHHKSHIT
jgi:hypothetical protein